MAQSPYEVFLSYARIDQENNQFVTRLASEVERVFRSRTGQPLRIFLDTKGIATAQLWRDRIEGALARSALMIAVLTPSYFTSEWCVREWQWFEGQEEQHRRVGSLGPEDALIFPVRFLDLSEVTPEARQRVEAAQGRQHRDLVGVEPDSPEFQAEIEVLVGDLIPALHRLRRLELPSADQVAEAARRQALDPISEAPPFPPSAIRHQRIATRIGHEAAFVRRLAEASQAIVVGLTNVRLHDFLEQALKLKRERHGRKAFWTSIHVVFANNALLPYVHDELDTEYTSRQEALHDRVQRAQRGRDTVASFFLLRAPRPEQCKLYEYPFLPPFVGALLEMPDSSKFAQVATLRPFYRVADYLFLEFSEMAGEVGYYQAAFEDVVRHSQELPEPVTFVGSPESSGFYARTSKFRPAILKPGRDPWDWVPAVLVCTYRNVPGGAEPLLQVRLPGYADREVCKLSHISGYVYEHDWDDMPDRVAGLLLPESAARTAAARKLREELGLDSQPELLSQLCYHSRNTESLFFYLFEAALPPLPLQSPQMPHLPRSLGLPARSGLQPWSLAELTGLRDYQVLSFTERFLEQDLPRHQAMLAQRVLGLNLILHGRPDLRERLGEVARGRGSASVLLDEVRRLRGAVTPRALVPGPVPGEARPVDGLAGLQFREFYSSMLPFYARIGVPGAQEELHRIDRDPEARAARDQLNELHGSETDMRMLPIYG